MARKKENDIFANTVANAERTSDRFGTEGQPDEVALYNAEQSAPKKKRSILA